jgi:hypothetical protein
MLFRVVVDLPLHNADVVVHGKRVSAPARNVVSPKVLGCDPEMRRRAIQLVG